MLVSEATCVASILCAGCQGLSVKHSLSDYGWQQFPTHGKTITIVEIVLLQ